MHFHKNSQSTFQLSSESQQGPQGKFGQGIGEDTSPTPSISQGSIKHSGSP